MATVTIYTLDQEFDQLQNDFAFLCTAWKYYIQLYGTNSERIDLLNEIAPAYFGIMQVIMYEHFLNGIARITDASTTTGHPNLVLRRLIEKMDNHGELKRKLEERWSVIEPFREKIKLVRNKLISHRDLHLAIVPADHVIPRIDRDQIINTLKAIENFLNEFNQHFRKTHFDCLNPILPLGKDGEGLIRHLARAKIHFQMQKEGKLPR